MLCCDLFGRKSNEAFAVSFRLVMLKLSWKNDIAVNLLLRISCLVYIRFDIYALYFITVFMRTSATVFY